MKYCQKCGKQAADNDLICIDSNCKGDLGVTRPVSGLSEHDMEKITTAVWNRTWKRHVLLVAGEFSLLMLVGLLGLWQVYLATTNRLSRYMADRIDREFKTDRIRATISEVASHQAAELLISEIRPKVDNFEKQIDTKMKEASVIANNAVANLYSSMTNESFSIGDTNHLIVMPTTNGAVQVIVRLSRFPISGSVEGAVMAANSLEQRLDLSFMENISVSQLWHFDTNNLNLKFRYVIDRQKTTFFFKDRMPRLDEEIQFLPDGRAWRLITGFSPN